MPDFLKVSVSLKLEDSSRVMHRVQVKIVCNHSVIPPPFLRGEIDPSKSHKNWGMAILLTKRGEDT